MKKYLLILSISFLTNTVFAAEATVDITLSPLGDFKAKTTDVKGAVKKVKDGADDQFVGENIIVNLKSLKTGIELRDQHTQKHLETGKFPEAVLVKAVGKSGKGEGKIKIHGVEKEIKGTYKIIDGGKNISAEFVLKLSDLKIDDISYKGVGVEDDVKLHVIVPILAEAVPADKAKTIAPLAPKKK